MGQPVTEPKTGEAAPAWHHCGRCGALFQAPAGQGNESPCPKCGHHPAPDYDNWMRQQNLPDPSLPHPPLIRERGKKRKSNATRTVAKFVGAWIVILVLLVVVAKKYWLDMDVPPVQDTNGEAFKQAGENADTLLLRNAFPECAAALNGFFEAAAPESRAQFVIDPIDAVKRMAVMATFSPLSTNDGMKRNLMAEVIHTPRGPVIETGWESIQGTKLDAVFFKDKETWKIDWRELLRYSEQSWPLFLAESGVKEGEFRLLARERLAGEQGAHNGMALVFYSPSLGHMSEPGSPSPEFPVERTSADGRLLEAAFAGKKQGHGPFGSHLISSDPDDLIRVRVLVRRSLEDGHQKFTLVKVIACHWFSLDEPGYDVPPEKSAQQAP